ncbi:MAG: transcription elongation factor GreA [Candidatus Zambryskibacteria bacterium RIFCSPLOWO2_02_FULL_51_21]|uniref:Transcription elongation factor GreA n=1 Tax=Candidatus Zambryskibacteria bacterium RIFCSPHIGHO2_02_FULL_43_37 TaxID=1802749 RepID=A0A1G2THA9_9BACT|nr:MAG: transcription elongation factor GreA [Candidatus Zambryskibacteria bacterium RIFCSPHIGHO2_01_FULL_52_18]OHA96686.1 MAG: transcription elongation factor GreA [Candidatus Zambryskibacteria bacterium RIFCSPHIGHO2_02_FULL_43_37]OHB06709.1 MAG: transcription elongation factor GreA [Candidatus Zambryskibacteria bacterium RIFCSPLOWO2_01_FULL_52_12]OHB11042.1 MAG: transcription elongation factor GreA [Candidatus Zambryskibacteria bacterium RIFCSPLOWO2_02_FULL_51_21]
MEATQEYLTKEKFAELEKELQNLKTVKRKEVAEALEYAKSLGDLSENHEYQEARDSQAVLEDRISRLEKILKTAAIVSVQNASLVGVGSVITLERESDKSKKTFTIVGSEEADASKGMISTRSPLGSAALGKSKGDTFSFETPSGTMSYKITDIK